MRITQERKIVVVTITMGCALAAVLWFAGVTSRAARPGTNGKHADAVDAPIPAELRAADNPTRLRTNSEYGKLPLGFEVNQGQTDAQVQFLSRGAGYTVFLTPTAAVLSLRQKGQELQKKQSGQKRTANVLRMTMVGANPGSKAAGIDQLPGKSNYFIGNDPTQWRVDVPSYSRVLYQDIYEGVDLVYYGNQRQLENDFVVAPGVHPGIISLAFEGAEKIAIDNAGDLLLHTAGGPLKMQKPVVYQLIDGERREIAARYVLSNRQTVGFEISQYDRAIPLVIDPVLIYSTFVGGTGQDSGSAIAVDSAGNAYISGEAGAASFPTLNSNQTFSGFDDVIVTKLNPSGTALVYSTFLGGNTGFEHGYAIAVDSSGAAYVAGHTIAPDFPTTANALQPAKLTSATQDTAFFTKLSPAGTLAYSTYLSGTQGTRGFGVATDGSGNAYVVGQAGSGGFPITASAFNSTNLNSGFLTKLNTNASGAASLVYSTFLGPTGFSEPRAVAVDAAGNAYITGYTGSTSTNLTSPGAFQTTYGGGTFDAFVAKFNTNLSGAASRIYSTYLGGSGGDFGGQQVARGSQAIAIDAEGNAYVTGQTTSTNFPTANAFQPANGGTTDAFLTKLNPSGSALVYSTYLGGSGSLADEGRAVAVNVVGNAYVTGFAQATNFPTANPITPVSANGGVFVAKFTPAGNALVYSTRLGPSISQDSGNGIALDGAGNAFITGDARGGYPTTPAAFQLSSAGITDAFVTQIADPTIIGRVLNEDGNPISTATVNLTGVPAATTTTDANGFFTFGLLTQGNNYTVSVSVAGYVFNPQGVALNKNVRVNFGPVLVTISGQVTFTGTSTGTSGVTMSLTGGKVLNVLTNSSGNYSFGNLPSGRNYTVTPAKTDLTFTPTSTTFNNISTDMTANFLAPPIWEPVVLTAAQVEIKTWVFQGTTYAYLKLSFPNAGYRVLNFGTATRVGSAFTGDTLVEKWSGSSVQAVTTTAGIYDLGVLTPGQYTFTFKNSGTTVKAVAFNVPTPPFPANPIDDARVFVRQQYLDFLNREPDTAGWDFWTDNITKCSDPARRPAGQTEAQCTLRQRETTSGAFFLSPEFQYTRYFVYRMYVGALGRQPKLSEFSPDAQVVGNGIVVNDQLSGAKIEQNKAAFAAEFVNCVDATKYRCAEFKGIYDALSNQAYVDKLFQTTGINASASDRAALVNGLSANPATETRASVLQKVVDGVVVIAEGNQQFTTSYGQAFYLAESNRAFVQFEYFGYMKRDPDDGGYAFWLGKLNSFGGDFVAAEMVLAFISSPEYRAQFGAP